MSVTVDDDLSLCGDRLNLDLVSDLLYQTANYLNSKVNDNNDNTTTSIEEINDAEAICGHFCDSLGLPSKKCKMFKSTNSSIVMDEIKRILGRTKLPKVCTEMNNVEICDSSFVYKLLVGYCFPALLTICIFGNFLNLLVYSVKELRKSTTVKMLMAKSVVNTLFMLFLLPICLLLLNDSQSTVIDETRLWRNWPYFMFLSNIAGTCAAW